MPVSSKGKPLQLVPGVKPCIRCGFCCQQAACTFGRWDHKLHRCVFLQQAKDGRFDCSRYHEILRMPLTAWFSTPAFGAGCSSSLNSARQKLEKDLDEREQD